MSPSQEVRGFPSCVRPLSPHLQSSSRQSDPRSLTNQAPRQPATQLLSGCVPADSHAPPLCVRPPPRAHARPYTPRVTAGPAPACRPAPLPRACHVGRPGSSVQLPQPTWSSNAVHPGLASYLSPPHPPFLSNSILDSKRPRRLLYSLETFHLSFCALCGKLSQPGLHPEVECPSLGRHLCFNTADESKRRLSVFPQF